MHKPLSHEEVEALNKAVPVAMTRKEKLLRWAAVLRQVPGYIPMCHGLEYQSMGVVNAAAWAGSPMALAAADPQLSAAGLTGATVGHAKKFFELTNDDIHLFSCDCGGHLTGEHMAGRLEHIANRPL